MIIRDAITSLLPKGPLWDSEQNPLIISIVDFLESFFQPFADKIDQAKKEIHPTKAQDLADYAATFGIDPTLPKEALRAEILLKIGQKGSQSIAFYKSIIKALTGLEVEIVEFRSRRLGKFRCGNRLSSLSTDFTFAAKNVPAARASEVIQIVAKVKEIHTSFFVIR